MERQLLRLLDPQQEVQDAGVAQEHPRRFDEPFAEVFEPGRQHPDHERAGEQVAVVVHRAGAHVHGARQFGGVPELAVPVGEHAPEPAEGLRGDLRAQTRNVPLEEGPGERLHPARPGRVGRCEPGARESAAHPQTVLMLRSDLGEREAGDIDELDAPGQGLGNPADHVPRRAAEQQEHRLSIRVVANRAQRFEQAR